MRRYMIDRQIIARGITDPAVLKAMMAVPREAFVPAVPDSRAYEDAALPIGAGQTISQPYIVALMAEALRLRPGDRVLEVGTGSGYAAAVLACLAAEVYTIEVRPELADRARLTLEALGVHNVHVIHGDGTRGLAAHAPFDAIAVAAAGESIPDRLLEQLAVDGRLVMPVGEALGEQHLMRLTRTGSDSYRRDVLADVRFVPLVRT